MITNPLSSLTETKSSRKVSSFPAEMPLIKLIGAANRQSPVIAGGGFRGGWATRRLENVYLDVTGNTRLGCVLTNAIMGYGVADL